MAGCSVIVPINSETVLYRVEELLLDERWGRSDAVSAASAGLRLIEFFVSKHRHEWDNLAERIAFELPAAAGEVDQSAEKQRRRRGAALLDAFIAVHSSPPCKYEAQRFQRYTDAIVLWCSYRGQTLIRTVRGLSYTRLAFQHLSRAHPSANGATVDDAYQLLIGAQQYPQDTRQRDDLHRMLCLFPHVELVYPLDVRRQQCDRVKQLISSWRAQRQPAEGQEVSDWWKVGKQQSGLEWSGGEDVGESLSEDRKQAEEHVAVERERVTAVTRQALSHLDTHLEKLTDAMHGVFKATRAHAGSEEKRNDDEKQAVEEKETAEPSQRQTEAELVNLLGIALPPLPTHLTPSSIQLSLAPLTVVWQDALLHLHGQLSAIHQLQLRQGQQELQSATAGHRLHADNCLHPVTQWMWQLDKHADVQQLSEHYIVHLHWMIRTENELTELWSGVEAHFARQRGNEVGWQQKIASEVSGCGELGSDRRQRWLLTLMDGLTQQVRQRDLLHRSHSQLVVRQRETLLTAMSRTHPHLDGATLSLQHLSQLSKLLAAFQAALDQYRMVTHRRSCLRLISDTLGMLPQLLLREERIILNAISLSSECAALPDDTPLHSVSAVLLHTQEYLRLVERQEKVCLAVYQRSVVVVVQWLQAQGVNVLEPDSPNCASYAEVTHPLFSLLHSALQTHFTSSISRMMTDLLQIRASIRSSSLPFSSIFEHVKYAAALLLNITDHYYTVTVLRHRSDSAARLRLHNSHRPQCGDEFSGLPPYRNCTTSYIALCRSSLPVGTHQTQPDRLVHNILSTRSPSPATPSSAVAGLTAPSSCTAYRAAYHQSQGHNAAEQHSTNRRTPHHL